MADLRVARRGAPGKKAPFSFPCDACGSLVTGVVWVPIGGTVEVQGVPCPGCPATYTVERSGT